MKGHSGGILPDWTALTLKRYALCAGTGQVYGRIEGERAIRREVFQCGIDVIVQSRSVVLCLIQQRNLPVFDYQVTQ